MQEGEAGGITQQIGATQFSRETLHAQTKVTRLAHIEAFSSLVGRLSNTYIAPIWTLHAQTKVTHMSSPLFILSLSGPLLSPNKAPIYSI